MSDEIDDLRMRNAELEEKMQFYSDAADYANAQLKEMTTRRVFVVSFRDWSLAHDCYCFNARPSVFTSVANAEACAATLNEEFGGDRNGCEGCQWIASNFRWQVEEVEVTEDGCQ